MSALAARLRSVKVPGATESPLVGKVIAAAVILFVILLPFGFDSGSGFIEDCTVAAFYVVMALGLNIVVGFAGLLDLGYVAFFAFGAYTMG
ncbi:MAG TPA: hypothetical protein VF520_02795, partial [Thermoleophilaceae bacterium]